MHNAQSTLKSPVVTISLYVQHSGHYITICTAQWSLYHYMYSTVATISLYVPHSGHCITTCTAQWSLYHCMYRTVVTVSLYVPHSGHCMYRQFNPQQFYVLPTQCVCVFCVDLRTHSDYFTVRTSTD
jgi:hypothetical protein